MTIAQRKEYIFSNLTHGQSLFPITCTLFAIFAIFYGSDYIKSSTITIKIIIVNSFRKVNKYLVYVVVFNGWDVIDLLIFL